PARVHHRRGQGLHGRPRGHGAPGRSRLTHPRRLPRRPATPPDLDRRLRAVPCQCGHTDEERDQPGRRRRARRHRGQAADFGALRSGHGADLADRRGAALPGRHPHPCDRPDKPPADLGRSGRRGAARPDGEGRRHGPVQPRRPLRGGGARRGVRDPAGAGHPRHRVTAQRQRHGALPLSAATNGGTTGAAASTVPGGVPLTVDEELVATIDFAKDANGLVPAIVQDATDGTVLTMAYMDAEALRRTLSSGRSWFYSRSRQEYWQKGETSGIASTCARSGWTVTATRSWSSWT